MQQHFRKIDFLRGIAILTVFQAHFIWYYFPAYAGVVGIDGAHPLKKWFLLGFLPRSIGWGGVTIFILVSGFLLHLGFLRDQARFTLRGFYSRRFWRVYPPYLLVLLAFSLFLEKGLFTTSEGWWTFLLHVFSLQNLSMRTFFSVNPTFWCLAAEVQLYGLYAIFLLGRARWGIKTMTGITFLVSVIWQTVGVWANGREQLPSWSNSALSLWVIWAMGAFLAEAYHQGTGFRAMLSRRDRLIAVAALILAGLVAPLNALLQVVAGLIGVFGMDAFLRAERVRLLSPLSRIMVAIGLCSFSVFLIHQPLIQALLHLLNAHSPHYHGYRWVNGIPVTLFIFGLSWLMYRFVELPSIAMGKRLRSTPSPGRLRR